MTDDLLIIQAPVTKTADFLGAGVDLGSKLSIDTPLWLRIRYYNAANATNANSIQFQVTESDDNFTTNNIRRQSDIIALTTVAKHDYIFIPLLGCDRYIKLGVDFSGAGTLPTVTYEADIVMSLN